MRCHVSKHHRRCTWGRRGEGSMEGVEVGGEVPPPRWRHRPRVWRHVGVVASPPVAQQDDVIWRNRLRHLRDIIDVATRWVHRCRNSMMSRPSQQDDVTIIDVAQVDQGCPSLTASSAVNYYFHTQVRIFCTYGHRCRASSTNTRMPSLKCCKLLPHTSKNIFDVVCVAQVGLNFHKHKNIFTHK
jgi:hypothetical protein